VHTPFAFPLPFADGRTYTVGAATLSLRERGAPAGFNVIETDAETISVLALGWTGSHFEPERTWALPRRASAIEEAPRGRPAAALERSVAARQVHDQRDHQQHQEDVEQDPRDPRRRAGNAGEAQKAGDQRNNQED
jgi:hypothetical protein